MSNSNNLLFGRKLENEFSWSKSRDKIFRECLRQYYFNYYGSWGGWKLDAPKRTRDLYILKKLQNRYMWIGSVVHSAIERSLKNLSQGITPLSEDKIIGITLDMMRSDFASSRRKLYRQNPKTLGLFEHEYDVEIGNAEWKEIADRVERCLSTFYNSIMYKHLYDMPRENWLETEELSSFYLAGTKVFVVLDCFYQSGEEYFIADWKTGKVDEEDVNIQLTCYALYVKRKWGVDFSKLSVTAFNLNENILHNFKLSEDLVEGMKKYIAGSIADMKKLLKSEDKNEALEEEAFEKSPQPYKCEKCNFRKVCLG